MILYVDDDVVVRLALESDIEDLVRLETSFVNKPYRIGEDGLRRILSKSPGSVIVLMHCDEIVGSLYSVRMDVREIETNFFRYSTIFECHVDIGNAAYWLHFTVASDHLDLVNVFHKTCSNHFFDTLGCLCVYALTHCSNFSGKRCFAAVEDKRTPHDRYDTNFAEGVEQSLNDYLLVNQKTDRNLFFHLSRGAVLKSLLKNYNPHDHDNFGYCIVLRYDHPVPRKVNVFSSSERKPLPGSPAGNEDLVINLEAIVRDAIGLKHESVIDEQLSWWELGLDSASLMSLHSRVEHVFGEQLNVSFLFSIDNWQKLKICCDRRLRSRTTSSLFELSDDGQTSLCSEMSSEAPDQNLGSTLPKPTFSESVALYGVGIRIPGPVGTHKDIESREDLWNHMVHQKSHLRYRQSLTDRGRFYLSKNVENRLPDGGKSMPLSHRLVLECAQAAINNTPSQVLQVTKKQVGVFVGAWGSAQFSDDPSLASVHALSGVSNAIHANRVSHCFDFVGPSMVIDTACSSSLVALDCAHAAINSGKCMGALVIGVNEISETRTKLLERSGFLSPSLHCFPFDNRADGYVRSEGCVAFFIGPRLPGLSANALILATSVRHDGKSVNLHAPKPEAQVKLIENACKSAGIDKKRVSFVEAHGTGTILGDAIEAHALDQSYGLAKTDDDDVSTVWVRASKAQFGHLESAAGMIGIMCSILCLQHKMLPANDYLQELNLNISLARNSRVRFVQDKNIDLVPKAKSDSLIYAGISSFGFGGAIAHTIVAYDHCNLVNDRSPTNPLDYSHQEYLYRHYIPYNPLISTPSGGVDAILEIPIVKSEELSDVHRSFLSGHCIGSQPVLPAAYFIDLVLDYLSECLKNDPTSFMQTRSAVGFTLSKLDFIDFVGINGLDLLYLRRDGDQLMVHSREGNVSASMEIASMQGSYEHSPCSYSLDKLTATCSKALDFDYNQFYNQLSNNYSGCFQILREAWVATVNSYRSSHDELLAKLELPKQYLPLESRLTRTALLDSAFQACILLMDKLLQRSPLFIKTIELLRIYEAGSVITPKWVYIRRTDRNRNIFELMVFGDKGQPVLSVGKLRFKHFQNNKALTILYRDIWLKKNYIDLASQSSTSEYIIHEKKSIKELHREIQKYLELVVQEGEQNGLKLSRILVFVKDEEQAAYIRSVRSEIGTNSINILRKGFNYESLPLSGYVPCDEQESEIELLDDSMYAVRRLEKLSEAEFCRLDTSKGTPLLLVASHQTYLVSGGLGGIGLSIAKELLLRGAGKVILLGRSNDSANEIKRLNALASGEALYVHCDISDRDSLKEIFDRYGRAIFGIFHCAGVLHDGLVRNLEPQDFDIVYKAKVQGALNLLSFELPKLAFVVLCSSVAAGFGFVGQANYASANGALDQIALSNSSMVRDGDGKPRVLSVRWGPWELKGMAIPYLEKLEKRGFAPLGAQRALDALFSLSVELKSPVITIAEFDFQRVLESYPLMETYLSEVIDTSLKTSKPLAQCRSVEEVLGEIKCIVYTACDTVGYNRDDSGEKSLSWRDAGLDSLAMIELRNLVQQKISSLLDLTDALLFEYPNPSSLIAGLGELIVPKLISERGFNSDAYDISNGKNMLHQPFKFANSDSFEESVLVTGVACRLPGGVSSPESFWEMLCSGNDAIGQIPLARFNVNEFKETIYCNSGAFIDGVESFDYQKFGIPKLEVYSMDPQQRICLEIAFQALSDANLLESSNRKIGVFVGYMGDDWSFKQAKSDHASSAYTCSGRLPSAIANRVSYVLGLTGPSITVNTACSSSLVAIDLACKSLFCGDCSAAIVIGVNLILSPHLYVEECSARMLSPTGKCHSFSSFADGYVRGEGCVGFVLQRSVKPGDSVWGRICSIAVNHGGKSAGFIAPNVSAQESLIRSALEKANLGPDAIEFLETHGTGTALGDLVEVSALARTFQNRTTEKPLYLGAGKTIFGHTEATSGAVGVLKALLSLNAKHVPPNLNCSAETISSALKDAMIPCMKFPGVSSELPCTISKDAFAGVSSFGFTGTNAHVVLSSGNRSLEPSKIKTSPTPAPSFGWAKPSPYTYHVQWIISEKEAVHAQCKFLEVSMIQEVVDFIRDEESCFQSQSRFVFVTRGLFQRPSTAAIWGFIRSLRLECGHLHMRLVDIPDSLAFSDILILEDELDQVIEFKQPLSKKLVIRVPRIRPLPVSIEPYTLRCVKSDSIVMITGASGGIAREIIKFLVNESHVDPNNLICVSRKGPVVCDVSDRLEVEKLAQSYNPSIIIHAVGVLEHRSALKSDPNWLCRHMAAKVDGTQNLLEAFASNGNVLGQSQSLQKFIAFSSTSASFGMNNGAAYAAANAAQGALLMNWRKTRNSDLQIVNIEWDLWNGVGMANESSYFKNSKRGFSKELGCQILAGIILNASDIIDSILVASIDDLCRLRNITENCLFNDLVVRSKSELRKPTKETSHVLASGALSLKEIEAWILQKIPELFFDKDERPTLPLSSSTAWNTIGLDSIGMVEFVSLCNTKFGFSDVEKIIDTALLDYPNPSLLARYIFEKYESKEKVIPSLTKTSASILENSRKVFVSNSENEEVTYSDEETLSTVVVVGLALRFPGAFDNSNPTNFWNFLCEGRDAVDFIDWKRFRSDEPDTKAGMYASKAGLLHPDLLEALKATRLGSDTSFGISPAELESMDPQQKIALQVGFEAFREAKRTSEELGIVGVFVGVQNPEFSFSQQNNVNPFTVAGTSLALVANRISYCLGFTGPSVSIDTACSSSLFALDAAIKAIHAGDCQSALVVGVDIIQSLHRFETTCSAKMLSHSGSCSTFSKQADGYVRGEGCGAIFLTLQNNENSQIPAWASIAGVAVTHSGRTAGPTAPSREAQEKCIRIAHRRAGISSAEDLELVEFVESHGTGTILGDAQELNGLANVFRGRRKPLVVGAVKTNIGHLEAASGVAGLIKGILCLANRKVPVNLHCDVLNPIAESLKTECNFAFPINESAILSPPEIEILGGVTCLGFGGTNSHVVLRSVSPERVEKMMMISSEVHSGSTQKQSSTLFHTSLDTGDSSGSWIEIFPENFLNIMRNHRVGNASVVPATTYIDMVAPVIFKSAGSGIGRSCCSSQALILDDLVFHRMLFIDPEVNEFGIRVSLSRVDKNLFTEDSTLSIGHQDPQQQLYRIAIHSLDRSVEYATMRAQPVSELRKQNSEFQLARSECCLSLPVGNELYSGLGNEYGGSFRGLVECFRNTTGEKLIGKIRLDPSLPNASMPMVWSDVASHVCFSNMTPALRARLIYAARAKKYYSAAQQTKVKETKYVWSYVHRKGNNTFNMQIFDSTETNLLIAVENFEFGFLLPPFVKEIVFKDIWTPIAIPDDPQRAVSEIPDDIVVIDSRNDSVKELHRLILDAVHSSPRMLKYVVVARSQGQVSYLRSLRREKSSLDIRCIWSYPDFLSLDRQVAVQAAVRLPTEEKELRFESSKACIRRLDAFPTSLKMEMLIKIKDSAYLVTGGCGGLGSLIAAELLGRGAKRVYLVGRTKPKYTLPSGQVFIQCDVTDQVSLKQSLKAIIPSLRGIIHCAGTLRDRMVSNMLMEDFEYVWRAKVDGAKNVLETLDSVSNRIDFIIFFSSVAAGLGSGGQANYAAANGALDELACREYRAKKWRGICSIRWGPWLAAGMSNTVENTNIWESMGLRALESKHSLDAMFSLPCVLPPVVTISHFDFQKLKGNSYFGNLLPLDNEDADSLFNETEYTVLNEEMVLVMVLKDLQRVSPSRVSVSALMATNANWQEVGLDSLQMTELRNLLQKRFQWMQIEETDLFNYGSPRKLAHWIQEQAEKKIPKAITCTAKDVSPVQKSRAFYPINAAAVTNPSAVISIACRLPGNVSNLSQFWKLICSGTDIIREMPSGRYHPEWYCKEDRFLSIKPYTMKGAFIDDIEHFANAFFQISDQEANEMDPQQRLALEVGVEALHESGLYNVANRTASCRIGVFVGSMYNDWWSLKVHSKGDKTMNSKFSAFSATGHANSMIANRISYCLGLDGPSVTIDTACSSSLVALDCARSMIASGSCDAALVLGVNLILSPQIYAENCAARLLSRSGKCSAFSAVADGYVRGEGCVALVVQPKHMAAPDAPLAFIHSTAVNQNGRSASLTSPNGHAQEKLFRRALSLAQLDPKDVTYIEAHGTGTIKGDTAEIEAMASVFREAEYAANDSSFKVCFGTIKPILGHGEAVSGLIGLLKAIACLHMGEVPGNFSLQDKNAISHDIRRVALPCMVFPTKDEKFPLPSKTFAGVSSFGLGGTNAHAIVSVPRNSEWASRKHKNLVFVRKRFGWSGERHLLNHSIVDQASIHRSECFHTPIVLLYTPGYLVLDYLLWKCTITSQYSTSIYFENVGLSLYWKTKAAFSLSDIIDIHSVETNESSFKVYIDKEKLVCSADQVKSADKHLENNCESCVRLSSTENIFEKLKECMELLGLVSNGDFLQAVHRKKCCKRYELKFCSFDDIGNKYAIHPDVLCTCLSVLVVLSRLDNQCENSSSATLPEVSSIRHVAYKKLSGSDYSATIDPYTQTVTIYKNKKMTLRLVGVEFQLNQYFGDQTQYLSKWVRIPKSNCYSPQLGRLKVEDILSDPRVSLCYLKTTSIRGVTCFQEMHASIYKIVLDFVQLASKSKRKSLLVLVSALDRNPSHALAFGMAASLLKEMGTSRQCILRIDMSSELDSGRARTLIESEIMPWKCFLDNEIDSQKHSMAYQVRFDKHETRLELRLLKTTRIYSNLQAFSKLGTCVVTGGLGGLGLITILSLLELGIKHIVVLSRSGLVKATARGSKVSRELYDAIMAWPGADVVVRQCDVSSFKQLRSTFDFIDENFPPCIGIVHAAGILQDGLFISQEWNQSAKSVVSCKADAALHLHNIAEDRKYRLEFFLLFSSIASILGAVGQVCYAGANAVLDALADYRQNQGLPATSINWGAWGEIGMAASMDELSQNNRPGMAKIGIVHGKRYIKQAICGGLEMRNFLVAPMNWALASEFEVDKRLLNKLLDRDGDEDCGNTFLNSIAMVGASHVGVNPQSDVSNHTKHDVENETVEILRSCLISDMTTPFIAQGLDSLHAVEISAMIREKFDLELSPTFYLDIPDGQSLLEWIWTHRPTPRSATAPRLVGNVSMESQRIQENWQPHDHPDKLWLEPRFKPAIQLFCFAYAGGHPSVFEPWMSFLPAAVDLRPISMPGFGQQSKKRHWSSIQTLASSISVALMDYISQNESIPFAVVGSCLGAIVAFEVCRILIRKGARPAHFFALNVSAPNRYAEALRRIYDRELHGSDYFFPSDRKQAQIKFCNQSRKEREKIVDTLTRLGFFRNQKTLSYLLERQNYFEDIMMQLASQMQLAERYEYTPIDHTERMPLTSICGVEDSTVPMEWAREWSFFALEGAHRHVEVPDAGHYLVQTHEEYIVNILSSTLRRHFDITGDKTEIGKVRKTSNNLCSNLEDQI